MIRRPPRSTLDRSSAASDVYKRQHFYNADGEMMFVPQQGALVLRTELGTLEVAPGEIAVVPRGIIFCDVIVPFLGGLQVLT